MGQVSKIAQLIPVITGSSRRALLLISAIVILIIADIQFVSFTYGSNLEIPSSFHLYLFMLSTIAVSAICILLLLAVKSHDSMTRIKRPRLSRVAYVGTLLVQISILLILIGIMSEILIYHQYNTLFLLLVVYISHFFSAGLLVVLSLTFLHWFKLTKSFSMLIYAIVFLVTVSLFMLAIPLLTEQYTSQPQWIYPRSYESLVDALASPTPDVAYIFSFIDYVLPIMIVCSWILTASLLRGSAKKIGKVKFWVIISIPLLYQFMTYVIKNTNLITDPNVVQFVYSSQFQIITGISYQISGIFFAIAFLAVARETQRKVMKNYLIICAIGIVSLFSSMQPGMPFYTAYPPFGLVTLSFLGISSYMLLVGVLGSAAYISTDSELRREVFKGIDNTSDLFKMGRAEMQREIESRVREAYKHINILDEMTDRIDKDEDIKVMMQEDDDPDITLTFKAGLDDHYYGMGDKRRRFEVYSYNDPLLVLEEFKPHFYDLLLTDINMPNMNGFQLCEKIIGLDVNIRVCFMSALAVNIQALREVYRNVGFGCFIEKPVSIKNLIERLSAELD